MLLLYIGGSGPERLCGSFREACGARYGTAAIVRVTYGDNLSLHLRTCAITLNRANAYIRLIVKRRMESQISRLHK